MTVLFRSALRVFGAEDEFVEDDDNRADEMMRNLSKSKKLKNDKSRNSTYISILGVTGKSIFLTLNAKQAFNCLRQLFIKALILRNFNLECHILIKINASSYAIGVMFSQLNIDWVAPNKPNSVKSKI